MVSVAPQASIHYEHRSLLEDYPEIYQHTSHIKQEGVHPLQLSHSELLPYQTPRQSPAVPSQYSSMPHRESSAHGSPSCYTSLGMVTPVHESCQEYHMFKPTTAEQDNASIAQALDFARESDDGAQNPIVSSILLKALSDIWDKVSAAPDSYVMTKDEFAVFNFFQHRFKGNKVATAARARYWNSQ